MIRTELTVLELCRILRLLGEAGILTVPLKGLALAGSLNGEAALRVSEEKTGPSTVSRWSRVTLPRLP